MRLAIASPSHGARYSAAMRTLHWGTAAFLVGSYSSIWIVSGATNGAAAARLVLLHRSFGLTILILTAIRFCWRQRTTVPELPADFPLLQRLAARANETGLYMLLILQPLLGLCASMLHGDRLVLLGDFALPGILPVDRKLAHVLFDVHGTVALLLLGLIGMHVAAALYHQVILRDDVLATMLPGSRRLDPAPRRSAASR